MSFFETIKIRLFEPQNADQIQLMFQRINSGLPGSVKPDAASLLHSCSVPGDWIIELTWPGKDLPQTKTDLGRHLAESIRAIGMVHHTMWQAFSTINFDSKPKSAKGEKDEHQA